MDIIVYDHQIFAVNRNEAGNFSDCLVYKSKDGLHQIDFEGCALNYKIEHPTSSGRCIGDRNIEEGYFLLYTNGIKTKIIFEKRFVFELQNPLLHGTKHQRFSQLRKIIQETKYTTYDLT